MIARDRYPDYRNQGIEGDCATVTVAIILFLVVLILRSYTNLLHPGLYMEDATHYFNNYYGGFRPFDFVLQHPNGYYNVLNNFVAWLTAHLDVRMQPLSYHAFSVVMGIATATCILFSGLLRTRSLLVIAPLVLGLSGMNHIYYYITLTFQMYNVVILLLLLLFFPVPKSSLSLLFQSLLATLLVWSGPYSVVALPVSLLFLILFRNWKKSVLHCIVIANVLLYTLSLRESTVQFLNIFNESILNIAASVLFERIFFLELLGSITFFKVCSFFLLLALTLYALRKDRFYCKLSLVLFAIIVGSLAPLFLSIKFPLYMTVFPCHVYISQFFWLFFLLFTADRFLLQERRWLGIRLVLPIAFLCTVIVDNVSHPDKHSNPIMAKVPSFVRTIYLVEQLELGKNNQYVVLKTDNVIPIHLPPMVRVGSLRKDAKQLGKDDITIPAGREFILDKKVK